MHINNQKNQAFNPSVLIRDLLETMDAGAKLNPSLFENIVAHKDMSSRFFLDIIHDAVNEYCCEKPSEEPEEDVLLFWSIIILALLNESCAFESVIEFCSLEDEFIDQILGDSFITEELPFVLALTCHGRWHLLKSLIEDNNVDVFVRDACLRACLIMVAIQSISRGEFVEYLKKLLNDCIDTPPDIDNQEWCSLLVFDCCDIWPAECLEMIKDMFGFQLIDKQFGDINDFLKDFKKGQEACIGKLKDSIDNFVASHVGLEPVTTNNESQNYDQQEQKRKIQELERLFHAIDLFLSNNQQTTIGRNESCACGSGKKYKKCCLTKKQPLSKSAVSMETCKITFGPLMPKELASLSDSDRDTLYMLHEMMTSGDAQKACQLLENFIMLHPNVPTIYNNLFAARMYAGKYRSGLEILKETVNKFPNYLFGLSEYGKYCMRRGEPEKIPALFNSCSTLKQLYPDRDEFHADELMAFNTTMALFYTATGDLDKAKIYVSIIQKLFPESAEIAGIKMDMRRKLMSMKPNEYPESFANLMKSTPET